MLVELFVLELELVALLLGFGLFLVGVASSEAISLSRSSMAWRTGL